MAMGRASRRRRQVIADRRTEGASAAASPDGRPRAAAQERPEDAAWRRRAFLGYSVTVLVLGTAALTFLPTRWAPGGAAAAYLAVTLGGAAYRGRKEGWRAASQALLWIGGIWVGAASVYLLGRSVRLADTTRGVAAGVALGLVLSLTARTLFPPPPPQRLQGPRRVPAAATRRPGPRRR
jgi:hypothetical protein